MSAKESGGPYSHIISGDPTRISHKRARVFAAATDDLEHKIGRPVEAEDVVSEALHNQKSVFWLYLPKDPQKALYQMQLEAARHILAVVKVYHEDYKGRSVPTRVREGIIQAKKKTRAFIRHEIIRSTKSFQRRHLEGLVSELENWFNRARTYGELGKKPLEAVENALEAMKKNIA